MPPKFLFNNDFQRVDSDDDSNIEEDVTIPLSVDPEGSYLYYECTITAMLDSGVVVHNRLPQTQVVSPGLGGGTFIDTLASVSLDDPNLDSIGGVKGPGVNLISRDQYTDIVQRMAHSRYWFRLWGQAVRIGLQIPIPGIRTIGGVAAIPHDRNPQWAYNAIAPGGNYGGAILWVAKWSLWYTTAVPPNANLYPGADPSAQINGNAPLPENGIQAPFSQADDDAEEAVTEFSLQGGGQL